MRNIKKIMSMALCASLLFTSTITGLGVRDTMKVYAESTVQNTIQKLADLSNVNVSKGENIKDEESVEIIVSLKDDLNVSDSQLREVQNIKAKEEYNKPARQKALDAISALGIKYELLCEYDLLMNGFALRVSYLDAKKIQALGFVDSAEVSVNYAAPEVTTSNVGEVISSSRKKRDLSGNTLINVDPLTNQNVLGQGMLVSVIDSGLDVEHDVLRINQLDQAKYKNQAEMEARKKAVGITEGKWYNDKVVFGFNYNDQNYELKEAKEDSHGMHVSGIAVGNPSKIGPTGELVRGVAPEAQLMFMRVFSDKERGTSGFIYVKALEDSVKMGADAINMSLGSTTGTVKGVGKNVTNAILKAKKAGCVVAIAAGNDGVFGDGYGNPAATNPDYGLVGNPSVTSDSLSVAALHNSKTTTPVLLVKDLEFEETENFGRMAISEPRNTFNPDTEYEYVYCNLGKPEDFADKTVTGKLALVERGEISFVDKVKNAVDKGAIGVIVFNHASGGDTTIGMSLDDLAKSSKYKNIPVTSVGHSDGVKLKDNPNYKIVINGEFRKINNPNDGKITDFSSWGISNDGYLKPDITAPGGEIYSSINNNKYANMNGTSMASPHAAGAIALVKQKLKERFPNASDSELYNLVKSFIMSTARINIDPDTGLENSPRQQGAGVIDAFKAVNSDLYVTGDNNYPSINAGNVEDNFTFDVVVHNISNEAKNLKVAYSINTDAVEDGYFTLTPENLFNKTLDDTITVPANSSVTVPITVDISSVSADLLTKMPNGFFVEGFVKFKDAVDDVALVNIPYVGFRGDFVNLGCIEKPIYDFEGDEKPFYYYNVAGNPDSGVAANFPFTTLLTSEYDKTFFNRTGLKILGEYRKDGKADGELYLDRNKLAFNPKAIGEEDKKNKNIIALMATALRNYTNAELNIYKAGETENPVYSQAIPSQLKNFFGNQSYTKSTLLEQSIWEGKDKFGNYVPDGEYDYVVTYTPDIPGADEQKLEFRIIVDSKVPAVKGGFFDTATRKYKFYGIEESGSGLYATKLLYNNTEIPQNEDGTYTIPENASLSSCEFYMMDYAGNIDSIMLNNATIESDHGIVAISMLLDGIEEVKNYTRYKIFRINDDGTEEEVTGEAFSFSALPDEFLALLGLPASKKYVKLPYGKYKVKVLLSHEDIAFDETEKEFTLSDENKAVDVVFKPTFLSSYDVNFKLINETGESKIPAGIKIYATAKNDPEKTEFPIPQSAFNKNLYNWDFWSGEYSVRVEVPEGYTAEPETFDLTVEKEVINKEIIIKKIPDPVEMNVTDKNISVSLLGLPTDTYDIAVNNSGLDQSIIDNNDYLQNNDNLLYSIVLKKNGIETHEEVNATVSITLDPKYDEVTANIYLIDNGVLTNISTANVVQGVVTFVAPHFSDYLISLPKIQLSAPGTDEPGTTAPGTTAPGTTAPGTGGSGEPSTTTPGAGGSNNPGTSTPGAGGSGEPGTTAPGTGGSGEPGTTTPGAGGSNNPGTSTPGVSGTNNPINTQNNILAKTGVESDLMLYISFILISGIIIVSVRKRNNNK